MNDLKNKNIIVTGATGGIGNSIVKKLNDCEANILGSGTKSEKLDELKQNLLRLIENKNLRKEMGAQGQKWSAQHTWAKIAIEIYPDIKAHLQKQDANG